MADAQKFETRKKTWLESLSEKHPAEAQELHELISDWVAGDKELLAAYPSARMLARFIMTLPYVPIKATTIRNYIESLRDEA